MDEYISMYILIIKTVIISKNKITIKTYISIDVEIIIIIIY